MDTREAKNRQKLVHPLKVKNNRGNKDAHNPIMGTVSLSKFEV